MKNPMFLLLWLPSAAALVLAYFKILHRQWFPAGLLVVIGVTGILMSVWLLRWLNRVEIPSVPGKKVVWRDVGAVKGLTFTSGGLKGETAS